MPDATYEIPKMDKLIKKIDVISDWGEEADSRYRVAIWDDEKVLEMDGHDGCTALNVLKATEMHTEKVKI